MIYSDTLLQEIADYKRENYLLEHELARVKREFNELHEAIYDVVLCDDTRLSSGDRLWEISEILKDTPRENE